MCCEQCIAFWLIASMDTLLECHIDLTWVWAIRGGGWGGIDLPGVPSMRAR
ncbi:hypothetical protein R70199_01188 [Paraburkholderia domus]|nr:hypothetical protein R70199_01188 [Paraburkholderia domus]